MGGNPEIEYKKFISGVPSLLTKSRIKKLSDVSFPLDGDNSITETVLTAKCSWEEMFGQLLVFKIHHKHFNVPTTMKELHAWTCQQRQQEKLMQSNRKSGSKRSAIWEERVRRLSEVGFTSGRRAASEIVHANEFPGVRSYHERHKARHNTGSTSPFCCVASNGHDEFDCFRCTELGHNNAIIRAK
jgi:hypothetical protein